MFSRLFIYRPIFATVISIVIVIVGLVAMVTLPIARYPEIAPPTIQVSAVYPGANAQTVAETVATPIEQQINGVEGMAYLSSTSAADGSMNITVTFDVGTDLDMANVLVQNRVATAEPKLPEEVKRLGVTVKKKSAEITLFVCMFSPSGDYDDLYLSNYATLYVRDELARVPGVGDVSIFGAGDFSMRIWLDPTRLQALHLTTNDVVTALRDQNVQVAAGQIGRAPAPEGQAFQYTINALGRLQSVEQFENVIVRSGADGQLVRVKDLARVELGSQSYDVQSRFNGHPSCALGVYQLPGANALDVADGVNDAMTRLAERFPEGLTYEVAYDSTDVIRSSIKEVVVTLFITLALVILTVYVFLQNFRATLIPTITIPVSLIGTFAVMAALGYSINQLTLFGLVLVIGIVVDDAIVVVENVTRHLDEGETDPKKAAVKAMNEVTGPVIATTLVLLAVFIPTIFLASITGQLFRQFAVTISVATVFSSINALTMSPALCGVLLRPSTGKPFILFRAFNWGLDRTTSGYLFVVRGALRGAVVGLILFLGLTSLAVFGFAKLPTGFIPQEDEGWAIANVRLPDGAALQRTEAVMANVTDTLVAMNDSGVENVISITGFSLLDGAVASNTGSVIFTLDHWDDRPGRELHQNAILNRVRDQLSRLQEAVVIAFAPPSLPGIGMAGGFAMQIQDRAGGSLTELERSAQAFARAAGDHPAIRAPVYSSFRANVPQLHVEIDREQVRSLGIPLQDVFSTLGAYLGSAYVNDFNDFGRIFQVKLQAESEFRATPDDIRRLEIRAPSGKMVPLGSLLDVREVLGPQIVFHHNLYAAAKLSGTPAPGFTSGDAMQALADVAASDLPNTMGYDWTELSYQENKASGGTAIIFLFSIVLVYLVLAAQYESWSIPISVCMAVPTALLGAVAALMIRDIDNNVYTQIGVVLLIGLSAKTAILIVEFAKVQRDEGKSIVDAALKAARLRFRAVLMTAFSFILGVIPLLVASGAGAESRQALGTTVFGGMLVATVVSVVSVPMLYRIIQAVSEKLRRSS
ncbi:MAG: multidrug efflux RND transporter permease subunit [Phycisphaerales bacterium]|nr:multidrug efflux RND transporter permease subunit [Phycisphaerales bacterium]